MEKKKTFFIVFEGLSFDEKIKILKQWTQALALHQFAQPKSVNTLLPDVMKDPLLMVTVILWRWSIKTLVLSSSMLLIAGAMFLSRIWFAISKYGKDCFRKSCKIIKIGKSCCYIQVLGAMVTVKQSFLAVANFVTTVNDR